MGSSTKKPKTEDEKREDEILRRMLNTPPKPHKKASGAESAKRDSLSKDRKREFDLGSESK